MKIKRFFYRRLDKNWNPEYNRWIDGYLLLDFIYIYRFSLFGDKNKYKVSFKNIQSNYKPISYSVILSLEELKRKYFHKWLVPTSPDIRVKHNGKLLSFPDYKSLYD